MLLQTIFTEGLHTNQGVIVCAYMCERGGRKQKERGERLRNKDRPSDRQTDGHMSFQETVHRNENHE